MTRDERKRVAQLEATIRTTTRNAEWWERCGYQGAAATAWGHVGRDQAAIEDIKAAAKHAAAKEARDG